MVWGLGEAHKGLKRSFPSRNRRNRRNRHRGEAHKGPEWSRSAIGVAGSEFTV